MNTALVAKKDFMENIPVQPVDCWPPDWQVVTAERLGLLVDHVHAVYGIRRAEVWELINWTSEFGKHTRYRDEAEEDETARQERARQSLPLEGGEVV